MMIDVVHFLQKNPSIAVFLCLAFGYLIGKVRVKNFSLGATVGTLVAGLLIGQLCLFDIPSIVKNIFFSLFIFTIGYEVGPAFVNSFKKSGAKLIIQSVFFSAVAFATAMICFKVFHIGPGEGAGIISGSLTQSAVIGTANSAINGLDISAAQKLTMQSQVAIAYAITYVFGTAGIVIFIKNIAPAMLRINLKDETKKLIEKINFKGDANDSSAVVGPVRVRAFKVNDGSKYIGQTVGDIEKNFKNNLTFEKITRGDADFKFDQKTAISSGDYITLIGDLDDMVEAEACNLEETADKKYLDIALTKTEVMLTKVFNVSSLKDMYSNNIMLISVERNGDTLKDVTEMKSGDIITVVGPSHALNNVIKELGYVKDSGTQTDVSYLSFGIIAGILFGSLALHIHDVPITLGAGGGALFLGLFFGWYQNRHPRFGNIPASTRWFLKSVGLNLFIGVVGLEAGHAFVPALKVMGWSVLLIGVIVSLVPHILSVIFGKYVLKLNPVDIVGSLCGSGTITAGLNAVTEECGSSIFALSYTPTYAVGNILITIMGPLAIALLYVR